MQIQTSLIEIDDFRKFKVFLKIEEFSVMLQNTTKSLTGLKRYFGSMGKVFPFLIYAYRSELNLDNLKIEEIYAMKTKMILKWLKEHEKEVLKVWDLWKLSTPNERANIMMNLYKNIKEKHLNFTTSKMVLKTIWYWQGFLGQINKLYQANPRNMKRKEKSEFHLEDGIEIEDVLAFYDKIANEKYKMLFKIKFYSGLNIPDLEGITMNSFKKIKKYPEFYYISDMRQKSQDKDTQYLILFHKSFFNEIKEYFEKTTIIQVKKTNKSLGKIADLRKIYTVKREYGTFVEFEKGLDAEKDGDVPIFADLTNTAYSSYIKSICEKYNLKTITSAEMRRLTITRLREIFSLKDEDIFKIWTQHKVGILTKNYTLDLIDRMIKYLKNGAINEAVLIGSTAELKKEVKKYKGGFDDIKKMKYEMQDMKIERLENRNKINDLEKENIELKKVVGQIQGNIEKVIQDNEDMKEFILKFKDKLQK